LVLIGAVSAVVAFVASSAGALANTTVPVRSSGTTLHLYVSEPGMHRILRFPLDPTGLPAMQPDAVITGLAGPSGLAIGPDNRLYVADDVAHRLAIYEPGPGTGSKPSHVLSLPYAFGIGAVGVDGDGFVYAGYDVKCGYLGPCANADVYSALPSGNEKPIATYRLGGSPPRAFGTALVVNAQHLLTALSSGQPEIYSGAPKRPNETPYPLFCPAIVGWGAAWGPGNELYLTDIGGHHSPPQPSQVIVIPNFLKGSIPNCPASYAITSATIPLNNPFGMATSGGLLYVTSIYNPSAKSALVFVLDPSKAGAQTPLAIVDGPASLLSAPYALAIGL